MNLNRLIKRAKWSELEQLLLEQVRDDLGREPFQEHDSLEEAGIEEDTRQQPCFGNYDNGIDPDPCHGHYEGGVLDYVEWFYDGECPQHDIN